MEYYARFYGSRGPPMSAAALKATSNPRSGGSDSHQPLPQVPEIASTDDEEIHSSSSSLPTLDAAASASVSVSSVFSSSGEAPLSSSSSTTSTTRLGEGGGGGGGGVRGGGSIANSTIGTVSTSPSVVSNASVSSLSSGQVRPDTRYSV